MHFSASSQRVQLCLIAKMSEEFEVNPFLLEEDVNDDLPPTPQHSPPPPPPPTPPLPPPASTQQPIAGPSTGHQSNSERYRNKRALDQIGDGVNTDNIHPDSFEISFVKKHDLSTLVSRSLRRSTTLAQYTVNHNLNDFTTTADVEKAIDSAVSNVFEDYLQNANPDDYISAYIHHSELNNPIYMVPQRVSNFNPGEFADAIDRVMQSNQLFVLDGELTLEVNLQRNISGGARLPKKLPLSDKERSFRSKSVVTIKNNDRSCGYRAIFVAIRYLELGVCNKAKDKSVNPLWQKVYKPGPTQTNGAQSIAQKAGFNMAIDELNFERCKVVQEKVLGNTYQLIVFDGLSRKRVFAGKSTGKPLFIEHLANIDIENYDHNLGGNQLAHYNTITKITGYLGLNYYCVQCDVRCNSKTQHICKTGCLKCGNITVCNDNNISIKCDKCFHTFNNNECYNMHFNRNCEIAKLCPTCLVAWNKNHQCDYFECRNCKESYTIQPHRCFISTLSLDKLKEQDSVNKIIVCYDIESNLERTTEKGTLHQPMLLIAYVACDKCYDLKLRRKVSDCAICLEGRKVYFGNKCVSEFGDFLYKELALQALNHKIEIYVYAHNAKGYDGHFLLRDLFKRKFQTPQLVLTGNKILIMKVGLIRFLDTLNLFQQPLSMLPKSFGLAEGVEKGFFPHYFNKKANWDYVGNIKNIPLSDYGYDTLKPKAAENLKSFYDTLCDQNYIFNFRDEIIKYCERDVEILQQALYCFRDIFRNISDIDPITRKYTLASIGLEYYRARVMPENSICVVPVKGFQQTRKQSYECEAWLDYIEKRDKIEIVREYRIGYFYADVSV